MRRVKKTFNYSNVKITDTKTNKVLLDEKRDGKQDESKVAIDFIKEHGYNSNLDIQITDASETYVMSAEDFMLYGEKIEEVLTDETSSQDDESVGN